MCHTLVCSDPTQHPGDITASTAFASALVPADRRTAALDCGAGIGRVTKNLLLPLGFARVDLLDVSEAFLATARGNIASPALGTCYESGLAEFDFDRASGRRWSLIWVQWCGLLIEPCTLAQTCATAIYLKDDAFVEFFRNAVAALEPGPHAHVVLKENFLRKPGKPLVDASDSSVTRSDAHMKELWARAGVRVVRETDQPGWPASLLPVRMYALAPLSRT